MTDITLDPLESYFKYAWPHPRRAIRCKGVLIGYLHTDYDYGNRYVAVQGDTEVQAIIDEWVQEQNRAAWAERRRQADTARMQQEIERRRTLAGARAVLGLRTKDIVQDLSNIETNIHTSQESDNLPDLLKLKAKICAAQENIRD